MISIVVATGKNLAIGKDNQLLWHLPADLQYFKNLTSGHTIIMGRKTHESIGRALPNRRNIVITRNSDLNFEGCEVSLSLKQALEKCKGEEEIMIIGGESIYKEALPLADRIYRTLVDDSPEADRFFPEIASNEWHQQLSLKRDADEKNKYDLHFEVWNRKFKN